MTTAAALMTAAVVTAASMGHAYQMLEAGVRQYHRAARH